MSIVAVFASAWIAAGASFPAPLESALKAAEAPVSLRAAFTATLSTETGEAVVRFDPRKPGYERWAILKGTTSPDLILAVNEWMQEPAPDGRLFPDDLRPSIGGELDWRAIDGWWVASFRPKQSANDGEFDSWIASHLYGRAWIDPETNALSRIAYWAPRPFDAPDEGRVETLDQAWDFAYAPEFGASYAVSWRIRAEGSTALQPMRRSMTVTLSDIVLFDARNPAMAGSGTMP
jgi:hypothetical protein